MSEDARIEQILDADAGARDLVAVRGPDATAGGADARRTEVALDNAVERAVVRHDQVRVGRDQQPLARDAALGETVDLGQQHLGIDDDAVADHRSTGRGEHPRRQQMKGELPAVGQDHGVAGVVAALVAHNVVDPFTEKVGDLSLAFVAPLRTDEHDRWHNSLPRRTCTARDVRLTSNPETVR
jgi:hypothetical protein